MIKVDFIRKVTKYPSCHERIGFNSEIGRYPLLIRVTSVRSNDNLIEYNFYQSSDSGGGNQQITDEKN
jgi:hypothetical protein